MPAWVSRKNRSQRNLFLVFYVLMPARRVFGIDQTWDKLMSILALRELTMSPIRLNSPFCDLLKTTDKFPS